MKRFWKYFALAMLGQIVVLYGLMIIDIDVVWYTFYDPIFSFIGSRVKMGFNVIPIFLMVALVFSAYAALISYAILRFWKK